MAATPVCKESAYRKHEEKEETEASITNSFITTPFTVATMLPMPFLIPKRHEKESGGLRQEKFLQMHFLQRWKMPLCKFPELRTGTSQGPLGWGLYD